MAPGQMAAGRGLPAGGAQGGAAEAVAGGGHVRAAGPLRGAARARRGRRRRRRRRRRRLRHTGTTCKNHNNVYKFRQISHISID